MVDLGVAGITSVDLTISLVGEGNNVDIADTVGEAKDVDVADTVGVG